MFFREKREKKILIANLSDNIEHSLGHRVITVIEDQRLVVLGCTALFSKVHTVFG